MAILLLPSIPTLTLPYDSIVVLGVSCFSVKPEQMYALFPPAGSSDAESDPSWDDVEASAAAIEDCKPLQSLEQLWTPVQDLGCGTTGSVSQ